MLMYAGTMESRVSAVALLGVIQARALSISSGAETCTQETSSSWKTGTRRDACSATCLAKRRLADTVQLRAE